MTDYRKLKVFADSKTIEELPFRLSLVSVDNWNDAFAVKEYRVEVRQQENMPAEKLGIFNVVRSKRSTSYGWATQDRVFVLVGYGASLYRITVDITANGSIKLHRAELNLVAECNPEPVLDYPHDAVTAAILLTKRLNKVVAK